jgi:hypothetical protein
MAPADAVRNKEETQKQGIDTTHGWSRAAKEEQRKVITALSLDTKGGDAKYRCVS